MIVNYSFLPHLNVFLYPSFTELIEVMGLLPQTQTQTHTHTHTHHAGSSFGFLCLFSCLFFYQILLQYSTGHCPVGIASHFWLGLL